jgi:pimeloyl-ACP methyl ester carboxylesterase
MSLRRFKNWFVAAAACVVLTWPAVAASPIKNIVLVDGAFVDGFPKDFAADLPAAQAEFMAHAQMPAAVKVFTTPVTNPAWKLKPSWYMVAEEDKTINPDLERMYAKRAYSHKVEAEGASHAVYISHAKEVAALIEDAARGAGGAAASR